MSPAQVAETQPAVEQPGRQELPFVTVIMPIRNEGRFVERSLGSVLSQTYPQDRMEVLVADGMSTDGTREGVLKLKELARCPVTLLDNPEQIVPTGMNRALRLARGSIIVRVDGHCEIAPDYVHRCVQLLQEKGVECAGGSMVTIGENDYSAILAAAQSSPFGVGGVAFRTGRREGCFVDTLAFGAYRRDVFDRLGGFDEELVRNQDDEFNFRLTQNNGKIWMDPSIQSFYYTRSSLRKFWRQYYQYGFFKVRLIQKRGAVPAPRHLVPAAFVAAFALSALLAIATGNPLWLASVLGPYLLASAAATTRTAGGRLRAFLVLPAAFAVLHFAYGSGFLDGLLRWNLPSARRRLRVGRVPGLKMQKISN